MNPPSSKLIATLTHDPFLGRKHAGSTAVHGISDKLSVRAREIPRLCKHHANFIPSRRCDRNVSLMCWLGYANALAVSSNTLYYIACAAVGDEHRGRTGRNVCFDARGHGFIGGQ